MKVLFTDIASLVSPAERFGELEILENACFLVEELQEILQLTKGYTKKYGK